MPALRFCHRDLQQLYGYRQDLTYRRAMRRRLARTLDAQYCVLFGRTRPVSPTLDRSENRKLRHYCRRSEMRRQLRRPRCHNEGYVRIDGRTKDQDPRMTDGSGNHYVGSRGRRYVRNDGHEFPAHRRGRRRMTDRYDVLFVRRRNRKHFLIRWKMIVCMSRVSWRRVRKSCILIRLLSRRNYRRVRQYDVRMTCVRDDRCRRILHH